MNGCVARSQGLFLDTEGTLWPSPACGRGVGVRVAAHTLTPTLSRKRERERLACGTPGPRVGFECAVSTIGAGARRPS
jgi:hypothetical protein